MIYIEQNNVKERSKQRSGTIKHYKKIINHVSTNLTFLSLKFVSNAIYFSLTLNIRD